MPANARRIRKIGLRGLQRRNMESDCRFAGGIYTGVLKNGLPNGRGTLLRGDHRYTGEFINGAPAGRGVLYQNDGTIIEGKFFMEPAGFTGLRHLAFENGIEYWYQ